MGNRARYVLMLVFPISSKSLKNEIAVAVGECMEHLLTPVTKCVFSQFLRHTRLSQKSL